MLGRKAFVLAVVFCFPPSTMLLVFLNTLLPANQLCMKTSHCFADTTFGFQFHLFSHFPLFSLSMYTTIEKHIKLHFLLFKNELELKSTLPARQRC